MQLHKLENLTPKKAYQILFNFSLLQPDTMNVLQVFFVLYYTQVSIHTHTLSQVHTYIHVLLKDVQLRSIPSWFCSSSGYIHLDVNISYLD